MLNEEKEIIGISGWPQFNFIHWKGVCENSFKKKLCIARSNLLWYSSHWKCLIASCWKWSVQLSFWKFILVFKMCSRVLWMFVSGAGGGGKIWDNMFQRLNCIYRNNYVWFWNNTTIHSHRTSNWNATNGITDWQKVNASNWKRMKLWV